ncbi:MAG: DEAD/DEAH box helicase family protein, partial [Actinobacteria bacterium]|nr:DEAD/DEAH box helicase family protein [Actinomycetota bacterium]
MTARPCSLGIRSNVRHDPSAIRLTRRPLAPSGTIGISAAELCASLVTASSSRTPGRRRLAALQRANKPKLSIDSSWFVATLLLVTQAALAPFSTLAFRGTWRGYQELALAAFEADRASSNRQTYIVAPPGSGKTLLGMEIIRRLGARALVLVPNTAVQAQWLR